MDALLHFTFLLLGLQLPYLLHKHNYQLFHNVYYQHHVVEVNEGSQRSPWVYVQTQDE